MKTMKVFLMGVAASAAVATTTPAFADYLPGDEPKTERREDVKLLVDYLGSAHFTPSRIEFRALSADPVRDLVKVAESGKYATVVRARAVQSLGLYVDDERAVVAVDRLMTSVSPGSAMFGPTLVAYAAVHGEAVTEAVAPYAEHPNESVRLAAVIALGRFCGQAGYETLKNLLDSEEDPEIKARIEQLVN